ncbi:MAG: SMP-30/gluconolactonase/LRE family protein [Propionibacterium sp.]|nr:SMP-30/gluconolactonase/LRE family protein [Propionibacterium sp.]
MQQQGSELVEVLADGMGFTEGPVVMPDGRVALVSMDQGCVHIIDPAGGPADRVEVGGGPNGLAVGPDGALYVAQNGGIFYGREKCEPGVQVIRDGTVEYWATGMGAPNDLAFGPDGRLWVTDTRAEMDVRDPKSHVEGWIWVCEPDGTAEPVVTDGPVFLNGIGFDPAGKLLVTGTMQRNLLVYDPADLGAPPKLLHSFEQGWPDGLAIGPAGRILVALTAADRLDVLEPSGERITVLDLPTRSVPTNVSIGPNREAFITASGTGSLLRASMSEEARMLLRFPSSAESLLDGIS